MFRRWFTRSAKRETAAGWREGFRDGRAGRPARSPFTFYQDGWRHGRRARAKVTAS